MALPTPTGESGGESSDSESSSDGESSAGDDGDDDNESNLDGDNSISEGPINVPSLGYRPRAPPQLEHLEHLNPRGAMEGQDNRPDMGAIEAGVIGMYQNTSYQGLFNILTNFD